MLGAVVFEGLGQEFLAVDDHRDHAGRGAGIGPVAIDEICGPLNERGSPLYQVNRAYKRGYAAFQDLVDAINLAGQIAVIDAEHRFVAFKGVYPVDDVSTGEPDIDHRRRGFDQRCHKVLVFRLAQVRLPLDDGPDRLRDDVELDQLALQGSPGHFRMAFGVLDCLLSCIRQKVGIDPVRHEGGQQQRQRNRDDERDWKVARFQHPDKTVLSSTHLCALSCVVSCIVMVAADNHAAGIAHMSESSCSRRSRKLLISASNWLMSSAVKTSFGAFKMRISSAYACVPMSGRPRLPAMPLMRCASASITASASLMLL